MLLAQQLREYSAACFTGIWIESHEHDDALPREQLLQERDRVSIAYRRVGEVVRAEGGVATRGVIRSNSYRDDAAIVVIKSAFTASLAQRITLFRCYSPRR